MTSMIISECAIIKTHQHANTRYHHHYFNFIIIIVQSTKYKVYKKQKIINLQSSRLMT